jgi:hypothetical protein
MFTRSTVLATVGGIALEGVAITCAGVAIARVALEGVVIACVELLGVSMVSAGVAGVAKARALVAVEGASIYVWLNMCDCLAFTESSQRKDTERVQTI